MATYVLLHGAASDSWYWHRVAPVLKERGHDVVTPDFPCEDDRAGFEQYADAVVDAVRGRRDIILVAQSLAGFVAPIVCERVHVDLLVLVNAMIPRAGETGGQWWENTGQPAAQRALDEKEGRTTEGEFDPLTTFLHDVPPEIASASESHARDQSGTPFEHPWPLERWPDVPTKVLIGRADRLFPADFQRIVALERLGIHADEMPGGHLLALSQPQEVIDRLESYRTEVIVKARAAEIDAQGR